MTRKREKGRFLTPKEQIEKGDLSQLMPLDFLLIQMLPKEGTNIGGLYYVGMTVREITKAFKERDPNINSTHVGARTRSLTVAGLVTPVKMLGNRGTQAYQQTELGREVLNTWLAKHQVK